VTEACYLKYIYRKQVEEESKVRVKSLADFFQVKPPSVTEILQKLDDQGFLNYERYHGVEFTEQGRGIAQKLLRRHRLLETLLIDFLRLDSNEACEEASKMDFHASEQLTNTICKMYGHPESCVHDRKIFKNEKCCGEKFPIYPKEESVID